MSSEPIAKRLKFGDTSTVLVEVGPDRKQFHVHKSFLGEASDFFKAAFTGKFQEAEEQKLALPEDDPDVFESFLHWLYVGRVDFPEFDMADHEVEKRHLGRLIDLYLLADKVQVPSICQSTVGEFYRSVLYTGRRYLCHYHLAKVIGHLYTAPIVVLPFRQIILAWLFNTGNYAKLTMSSHLQDIVREYPEFAVDFVKFSGLKFGQKKAGNILKNGARYFYDDIFEKPENICEHRKAREV